MNTGKRAEFCHVYRIVGLESFIDRLKHQVHVNSIQNSTSCL